MAEKTFEQSYAETGRQSELDALRKSGGFDEAKAQYEGSGRFALPTPTKTPTSPGARLSLGGGKDYGGWYDNPTTGKNQRFWGTDAGGKEIWTDGAEPGATGGPTTSGQVTPYLNNFQTGAFNADGAPRTKVPTFEELKTQLTPEGGRPELLDRNLEFERLREEQGVAGLETRLTELNAMEEDEVAFFRKQRFDERGKPVATGVIAGRIGQEELAAKERLDFIGREKSRINDQLTTSYSLINMYMTNIGLDYSDATTRYNDDFTSNLKMYNIITDAQKQVRSEFESDRANANANLTTYVNAITAGNLDYASLSPDQKTMISKLEVQSGMPSGFIANLKMDPDANIIFQNTSDGITQVGIRNADGSISVEKYGTSTKTGDGVKGTSFGTDVTSFLPYDFNGETVGIFPQLVKSYATSMTLSQIYAKYRDSSVGREYGAPTEDPAEIKEIYNFYKTGEEPEEED